MPENEDSEKTLRVSLWSEPARSEFGEVLIIELSGSPSYEVPLTNRHPNAVYLADTNNDGDANIVLVDGGGNTVSVLTGDGFGGFSNATFVLGGDELLLDIDRIASTTADLVPTEVLNRSLSITLQ